MSFPHLRSIRERSASTLVTILDEVKVLALLQAGRGLDETLERGLAAQAPQLELLVHPAVGVDWGQGGDNLVQAVVSDADRRSPVALSRCCAENTDRLARRQRSLEGACVSARLSRAGRVRVFMAPTARVVDRVALVFVQIIVLARDDDTLLAFD